MCGRPVPVKGPDGPAHADWNAFGWIRDEGEDLSRGPRGGREVLPLVRRAASGVVDRSSQTEVCQDEHGGRFGDGPLTLSHLCASDVVRFVQRQAPRLHPKRAKLLTSALRSFLQYACYRGKTKLDLAAAVPVVANWSMSSIPRAIRADQVRQLLASIDRRTAMGCRDYAVLLLLARLGLRSGEVALLELDDVNWNTGKSSVRGKSGRRGELPLPAEVGEAIAAYLRRGRPQSTNRRVFLRAKAPIHGFQGASGVGSIVRHCILRADLDTPTYGAHQFRHGLATELLRQGASLAEIGELLGHHSPQTTKIYTKVDLDALRTLASPWPGGVR
jgi:integrase/recombinase XerD